MFTSLSLTPSPSQGEGGDGGESPSRAAHGFYPHPSPPPVRGRECVLLSSLFLAREQGWWCALQFLHYHFKHPVQIFQHIMVPEAHYLPALLVQILASGVIVSFLVLVLSAIQFDHQHSFHTRKVRNISAYRMLAPEAAAFKLSSPHRAPKPALNIGHVAAQPPCSRSCYRRNPSPVRHRTLPS